MSHTFYNSLDLTCKSPFGAVKAGQPVTFNLTVPEDLGYVDPHLVLTKDCEDPVHYRMEFTGQTPKVNHFALTVTPTTSGLYFYHFDLYTDFRRIYRTPGGEGVLSWTDGQDWQLTVYEPDFKTPDWLKNGTMYQIFPDRFCEGKPNKTMPFADRIYRADKTGEPYFWPTEQSEGYLNMDYYGGDFAGIQQKLPYLRDLGVTCIYLNPIFEAHANHRYNTADYLKADPLLGTNEEFSALCAAAAKEQGFDQIARLFEATSAAEQIHIGLEAGVIAEIEPGYERPAAPEAEGIATDLNLIAGALGEIYETSDMYPSFIKVAQEEGNKKAEFVFTRAKLAEAVHAELYMDAYNNIDAPTDEAYYLCPICGYIHKGDDFEKCPICFTPADKFRKF